MADLLPSLLEDGIAGIGGFYDPGYQGLWWSATENTDSEAWSRQINNNNTRVFRNSYIKKNGLSVRCVKD